VRRKEIYRSFHFVHRAHFKNPAFFK